MTYQLQNRDELLSPDYWGGVDIEDPSQFEPYEGSRVAVPRRVHNFAMRSLRECLGEVMTGDYVERKTPPADFSPNERSMPDGTVVVLDQEHLMKWSYSPGNEGVVWSEDRHTNDYEGSIREGNFAEYWRSHQSKPTSTPEGNSITYGQEGATFTDRHIMYGRYLSWGVLLTNPQGARVASTIGMFAAKGTEHGSVWVPRGGDPIFRLAEPLPLQTGESVATETKHIPVKSDVDADTFAIRSINRLREVRVVYPASGTRERQPSLRDTVAALIDAAKGIHIPIPGLAPAPSAAHLSSTTELP